jgi:hypothetical protein
MSKEEVLAKLNIDIENSKDDKGGEYFSIDVKKRLSRLIVSDRPGVVEALRYWLQLRQVDLTDIAVDLVRHFALRELKSELETLKKEVDGRAWIWCSGIRGVSGLRRV